MKYLTTAAFALGLTATSAFAGSIQRATDPSQILFERGKNYLQFSVTYADADISGTSSGFSALGGFVTQPAGVSSGDIAQSFLSYSVGLKVELTDKLTFALVGNNPVGADVQYASNNLPYLFSGSSAEISSTAITGYLKYNITDRWSVYGGVRATSVDGQVNLAPDLAASNPLFAAANYTLDVSPDIGWGYVLGAAFTIEEILMKFALTYESKTEHDFADNDGVPFTVEIPQSVTLHARSAVSEQMLVFGSIRWQEWSEFEVAPQDFLGNALNTSALPIAFGAGDYTTYEVGVARRLTQKFSLIGTFTYEPDSGNPVGNLEGRDGFLAYGIAGRYSTPTYDITAGVRYIDLGPTNTTTINSQFAGNDAIAFGLQLGYRF
ncbi:MAG: outer membrane protein transport protein [Pseudomonadota bacterium]